MIGGNGPSLNSSIGGTEALLQAIDEGLFATSHPAFAQWPIRFVREGDRIVAAGWGSDTLPREGSGFAPPASDPALARLAGRYSSDNPWAGVAPIAERGGKLWLYGGTPLTPLADGSWRIGKEPWSPERIVFANLVGGRPRTMLLSGEPFERRDI